MNNQVQKCHAIIIAKHALRESDIILQLLSKEHGRISGVARGAKRSKKRFSNPPDILESGIFYLKLGKSELHSIDGFESDKPLLGIRSSLSRYTIAQIIIESSLNLINQHDLSGAKMYEVFLEVLHTIDREEQLKDQLKATHIYLVELACQAGYIDRNNPPKCSKNGLLLTLDIIEQVSEKKLKTRAELEQLMREALV
jgi:DNA repair protein RecO (recombination protein O)